MDPVTIAVVAAVLVAIVEVVKRTVNAWAVAPPNPDRYVPALTLVLGIAAGALGLIDDGGWFAGLIAALTASGAYSGTKATATATLGARTQPGVGLSPPGGRHDGRVEIEVVLGALVLLALAAALAIGVTVALR